MLSEVHARRETSFLGALFTVFVLWDGGRRDRLFLVSSLFSDRSMVPYIITTVLPFLLLRKSSGLYGFWEKFLMVFGLKNNDVLLFFIIFYSSLKLRSITDSDRMSKLAVVSQSHDCHLAFFSLRFQESRIMINLLTSERNCG